jgi:hypothetical protein
MSWKSDKLKNYRYFKESSKIGGEKCGEKLEE